MKISVCMCTYNGENFIREQLDSLYHQIRQPDELILCDDGSQDRTVEIISEYIREKKLEAQWKFSVNGTNKGYPGNFYYAMSLCTGDIVFLADQDDVWKKDKLQIMSDTLEKEKGIKALACKFGLIDAVGADIHTLMAPTRSNDSMKLKKITLADIFYKYETPGMVLAYRNEWYRQRGIWSSTVPHDFLICSMAAEENALVQIDAELAYHRRHTNNAGGEEHRFARLLNKGRKLREIEIYLKMLRTMQEEGCLKNQDAREELNAKERVMSERYAVLCSGKRSAVLRAAIENRRYTRIATTVCDLLIVSQKN